LANCKNEEKVVINKGFDWWWLMLVGLLGFVAGMIINDIKNIAKKK